MPTGRLPPPPSPLHPILNGKSVSGEDRLDQFGLIPVKPAEHDTLRQRLRPRASVLGGPFRCWIALLIKENMLKHLVAIAGLFLAMASSGASAQVNAGEQKSDPNLPFTVTQVTTLKLPWRIAFLPDGRMLITEKVGGLSLVTQQGVKTPVANVPPVLWHGQGGMLGVYLSPHYAKDHNVYLTYSEPR